MSDLLGIIGGILIGIGTIFVIVVGVMYDRAEYEERQEEKRRAKEQKHD